MSTTNPRPSTDRDWFADLRAIHQEHAPRVGDVRICPRCKGAGELVYTGLSLNTTKGMLLRDPQMDVAEECNLCDGKGSIPVGIPDSDIAERNEDVPL